MKVWLIAAASLAAGLLRLQAPAPREWVDPDTGHRIVRLTSDAGGSTLYFHDNAFSPEGDVLMFNTPAGIALVQVAEIGTADLQPVVVAAGGRGGYFARRTREIFYTTGGARGGGPVMAVHVDTKQTRQVTYARGLVNADATLSVAKNANAADPAGAYPRPAVRPLVPQLQRMFPGKRMEDLTPDQQYSVTKEDGLAPRALNPSLQSFIFTDLATGDSRETGFQYGDLNHMQFNPVDPHLLLYCHEGTWHELDRTWTIRTDGTGRRLMHRRTMDMEINGHEWWSFDGQTVWFDLQTPRSQDFWIAGVNMKTNREVRYHLERDWWGVHFNSSRDDTLFASDGGDPSQVAYSTNGMWINLLRVQPSETVTLERLVNMSRHNYVTGRGGVEPNAHVTPDKKWVIFTGQFAAGQRHVYAVEIAKAQAPAAAARRGAHLTIDTPMAPPRWATLERQLLAAETPACVEFYRKYYDARGRVQCVVRWGADDGPDDAFENFAGWPELHALGGGDEVLRLYRQAHDGMIRQYTEAKTKEVPAGRGGMYYKEFSAQADWMHHGEGLRVFNRMGLSTPDDAAYRARARRFAGFYMGEDPEAPNYDPRRKLIRSLINGSRGPMLRTATPTDWVGDPIDIEHFAAGHNERNFGEMLAHYAEYGDVVGDSFLNLVATTLPLDAYLATGEPKYKTWIVDYVDAWIDRMKQNNGIIPSFVDLDGRIGGPEGKWWGNAYGWGFSPINPVTGRREDRNRIPRALVGFNNALFVTGDRKYIDAWRGMIDAVNAHAVTTGGRTQYPTMHGADGWYGWQAQPWSVGALEVWYWSMLSADRDRVGRDPWVEYLQGRNPAYPETALEADLKAIDARLARMRLDRTTASQRLADNMMDFNPAAVDALIRLTLGGLPPGRDGGLLNARFRYFDPARKRAGLPPDVAALVSALTDTSATVTLVNVSAVAPRTLVMQGGAYGEHRLEYVETNGRRMAVGGPSVRVTLAPGAGATVTVGMRRYSETPTVQFPPQ